MKDKNIVKINPVVRDSADSFIANRKENLLAIIAAVRNNDFAEAVRIGHKMKGVGSTYGFNKVTETGGLIEELAEKKTDAAGIEKLARELLEYLDNVEVI